ncbi:MAG: hypothetical protein ACLFSV_11880 [Alkalispirochaeta sp.]
MNELLGLFRSRNVEFIVVGAHALAYHGSPRFTGDLDLLVRPTDGNAERIILALEAFGFADLGLSVADFTTPDTVIQLGHPPARVDILTAITGVSWDAAFAGSVEGNLGAHRVLFLGLSELITNKRSTRRTRDLADLEALESLDTGSTDDPPISS